MNSDRNVICTFDSPDHVRILWINGRLEGGIDAKFCGDPDKVLQLNSHRSNYRLSTQFRVGQVLGDINALSPEMYEAVSACNSLRISQAIDKAW